MIKRGTGLDIRTIRAHPRCRGGWAALRINSLKEREKSGDGSHSSHSRRGKTTLHIVLKIDVERALQLFSRVAGKKRRPM
jgi:hypothetical protein